MRWLHLVALGALLGIAVGASEAIGGAIRAEGTTAGTPAACPITQPNGNTPPGQEPVDGGYGNDALWTNVWMWGEGRVEVPPDHVQDDGSLGGMKWAWWRYVPGRLTIEGRRLDGEAPPLQAEISDGYGEVGFQPVGLIFPTDGCWEVTGRLGEHSLTFVTWVVRVNLLGTPIATPSLGTPIR